VVSHLVTGPEGSLEIGDHVAIDYGAAIACLSSVRIGSGTRIGPFCVLADSDFHVVGDRDKVPAPRPVQIGDGVQIGARVTIIPGTTIGAGAIVGAHSVVGGVIAAGAVVSGVPARTRVEQLSVLEGAADLQSVPLLVQRVLGLRQTPALAHGPDDFMEWDSLGSLRLLLAIEDELGLRLAEQDMVRVRTVADLVAAIARASAASS
jgi:acyl carrier protein